MFDKIFIVNCGEIVLCVVCVCCEMGIKLVVVYLIVDVDVMYVCMVDEVICIGLFFLGVFYLNFLVVILVCEIFGVQVIYFGYGFFLENVNFVQIVEDYGLIFIGLLVEYICQMGDKIIVKDIVKVFGILVVLGFDGGVFDIEIVKKVVVDMGYLVIIKVIVGGGGCGMKVVLIEDDIEIVFCIVWLEFKVVFGNDEVYIEKYFQKLCYIEI